MLNKLTKLFYYLFIYPVYKIKMGKIGSSTRLVAPKIDGYKRIFLGNKIFICDKTWLAANPLTGSTTCKLEIDDGAYIGRFCHIYATSKISIGKKVLIADRVYLSDNLHQYKDIAVPVIDQPVKQTTPVIIGDGAWLGENVTVIGASVGKQSVIGANAVVLKDVPDYCVAAGIPARIIKRYNFEKKEWLATDSNGNFVV